MAEINDRVSLELIDAGDHKDRVVQILSKVRGLGRSPEELVNAAPCTIATDVPRSVAEKLQGFLEQAGAMVMVERPEELFSPEDFPVPEAPPSSPEAESLFEETEQTFEEELLPPPGETLAEEFASLSHEEFHPEQTEEAAEMFAQAPPSVETDDSKQGGRFQKLMAKLPRLPKKKTTLAAEEAEEPLAPVQKKKFSFSLPKWRKSRATAEGDDEEASDVHDEGDTPRRPSLLQNPVMFAVLGFLIGALLMGVWGWFSIQATKRDAERNLSEYNQKLAKQIEEHSAGLRNKVQEQAQEIEQLTQQNAEFAEQVQTLTQQMDTAPAPQRIVPSASPEIGAVTPAEATIVAAFDDLKAAHAQSLERAYPTQKQAACSRQLLLDGKGTMTYAQVVKKFTTQYTTVDIVRSPSLLTPYTAEFKVPFQQEIRIGSTGQACNAKALEQLPTPRHHEFGSFYGYWILQYVYQDGAWHLKSTVLEKNRALYDTAFKLGSPDYAKFLIDTDLFPGLKTP